MTIKEKDHRFGKWLILINANVKNIKLNQCKIEIHLVRFNFGEIALGS